MEPSRADHEAVVVSIDQKFMKFGWREITSCWMVVVMDGRHYNMVIPKVLYRTFRHDKEAGTDGIAKWLLGKRIAFSSAVEQKGDTFYVRRPTKVRVI